MTDQINPHRDGRGVPFCDPDRCPQYDGKRCRALGHTVRGGHLCEPAVVDLLDRIRTSQPVTAIPAEIEHAPTCATGARAELRGPCDCGAVRDRPYRLRIHATGRDPDGRGLVELEVESPMTTTDAVMLSIALQDLTRLEGQRWARADAKRTIPTIARTGVVPLEDEACTACGHRHAGPDAGGICVGCPCEERP